MTRQDFVRIAAAISGLTEVNGTVAKDKVVEEIGDVLAASNPRFDRDRFERACYGLDRRTV
jgi:hypothetical protein